MDNSIVGGIAAFNVVVIFLISSDRAVVLARWRSYRRAQEHRRLGNIASRQ